MKTLIPNGNQSIFNTKYKNKNNNEISKKNVSQSVQRRRPYHNKAYKKLDEQSSIILKLLV